MSDTKKTRKETTMKTLKKAFYLTSAGIATTAIVKALILAEGFAAALKGLI